MHRLFSVVLFGLFCNCVWSQTVRPPPQAEWDRATADLTGTHAAARDAAVEKVKAWINGGWVSSDLWRKWLPALVKANTPEANQQVADLALLGLLGRPNPDAVPILAESPCGEFMWRRAEDRARLPTRFVVRSPSPDADGSGFNGHNTEFD